MAYEIYKRQSPRRVGTPQVAIMKNGRVGFNKAAAAILTEQAVEYILLMWDKQSRKIGIKPIAKKDPRAFKMSKRENSASFTARGFFEDIGVGYDGATQLFPLVWIPEQGIFEFNLAEAITSTRKSPKLKEKPLLTVAGRN